MDRCVCVVCVWGGGVCACVCAIACLHKLTPPGIRVAARSTRYSLHKLTLFRNCFAFRCVNLELLDLSHNRIVMIEGLDGLSKLKRYAHGIDSLLNTAVKPDSLIAG